MSQPRANYLYANRDGRWGGAILSGAEVSADGSLRLLSLPIPQGAISAPGVAVVDSAGVAVDEQGQVFYTDPVNNRVLRSVQLDLSCADAPRDDSPAVCVGGEGTELGRFNTPRGLLIHGRRKSLFVADAGNHRIQILDPRTLQVLEVWDQINHPWAMVDDPLGNVYVLEKQSESIVKVSLRGEIDPGFWSRLAQQERRPQRPIALARGSGEPFELFVIDAPEAGAPSVLCYDGTGTLLRSATLNIAGASSIVAYDAGLLIADPVSQRLWVFLSKFASGTLLDPAGHVPGWFAPVESMCRVGATILVHSGNGALPARLGSSGAFARSACILLGPFADPAVNQRPWNRIELTLTRSDDSTHVQLFVASVPRGQPSPALPPPPESSVPISVDWKTPGDGVPEFLFPATQNQDLWICLQFRGEGSSTPGISQMRIDFDPSTNLAHLPPVLWNDPASREFLQRLLSWLEAPFRDIDDAFATIIQLLDPATCPAQWLGWLAGLLALDVQDNWDEPTLRGAIAGAFQNDAWRGTRRGLERALRLAGIDARIEEPSCAAAVWILPEECGCGCSCGCDCDCNGASALGVGTVLAVANPDGAVLGTSATLGQSLILPQDQYGVALLSQVSHRVVIRILGPVSDARLKAIQALVDREKPAHVLSRISVVEPRMRIGFQARIGIDTVIAGPPAATTLGAAATRNGIVVGDDRDSRITHSTRIGAGVRVSSTP